MPRVCRTYVGTPNAMVPGMATQCSLEALKGRFLTAIGYVCARRESPTDAFDRLRMERPDLFPVPRPDQSFWNAVAEVAADTSHTIDINTPTLKSYAFAKSAVETVSWAKAQTDRHVFRFVEMLTGAAVLELL